MQFKCLKVRKYTNGSPHNDAEGDPVHLKCFEVTLAPTEPQHEKPGGIDLMRIMIWRKCVYEEGQVYELGM